jgi:hypothetical protein
MPWQIRQVKNLERDFLDFGGSEKRTKIAEALSNFELVHVWESLQLKNIRSR